jgi:hypothetical protein
MGNRPIRRSRRIAATGLVAVAAVALTGTSSGGRQEARAPAAVRTSAVDIAGKVTIAVTLKATQRGTFKASGALRDSGPARAKLDVLGKRARMTLTLEGTSGKLKLLVTQVCGKAASTWTIDSGSRAYNELTGSGKGKGRITCGKKAAHRGVYTGVVRTPPPTALARPGTYSGTGFSPNLRMTFDVLPDGRTLTNVSFRQLVVRCQPPAVQFPDARFTGRYPLSDKGRFSIAAEGFTVAGRVSGTAAKGTIAYESGGCKGESVNWKAAIPPPLLPAVSPGRYCGFTLAGSGVCLDGTADAWVTRVRFEVKLRCYDPEVTTFTLEYVYGGALGVLPDLSFAGSLSDVPLPGGGSLRFSVAGKFDDAERVSGKGGFTKVTVVKDGIRYKCRNAVASFTAKLGA